MRVVLKRSAFVMCVLSIGEQHDHRVVVGSASADAVELHLNAGLDQLTAGHIAATRPPNGCHLSTLAHCTPRHGAMHDT